jgi:hypothetical protein
VADEATAPSHHGPARQGHATAERGSAHRRTRLWEVPLREGDRVERVSAKGLAGAGSDSTGVATRLVGQFLYWLQESPARVFVVATANDVRSLPQELLRRGRFDDMFFVDLPDAEERREIIDIYLAKYLRAPVAPDLVDELINLSEGFAGSDIESAVAEIGQEAALIGDDEVTEDYVRSTFRNVVPLSRSAPERIEEVRQLGERAIPASGRAPTLGVVGAAPRGRRVVLG